MLLMTKASGLLISWATPATIWPSAVSFLGLDELVSARFSSSWARRSESASGWSSRLRCSSFRLPLGARPRWPDIAR